MSRALKRRKLEIFEHAENKDLTRNIPDEILENIFKLLDNEAMKGAIQVCQRWRFIITTSTPLMEDFHVEACSEIANFPFYGVPIRNLTLRNNFSFNCQNSNDIKIKVWVDFIDNFASSLKNLKLESIEFNNIEQFYDMLRNLKKLKHLEIVFGQLNPSGFLECSLLPNLRSVSLKGNLSSSANFLLALDAFEHIKKLKCINNDRHGFDYNFNKALSNLLKNVPSIQHLSLEGIGTASYFQNGSFNFKLCKLEAYLMTFNYGQSINDPRLSFLTAQKDHLKELKLTELPYDYDGGVILKFLFDEMKLERFDYGNMKLIENGRKVKAIDEIRFAEFQIKSGLELLRQFPATRKLNLSLTNTGVVTSKIVEIFEPRLELLSSIHEIVVNDKSDHLNLLPHFTGLFKNCQNTKELFLDSKIENLNTVLVEVLPFMTQLKKIKLSVKLTEERMQIINENCPSVEHIATTFHS